MCLTPGPGVLRRRDLPGRCRRRSFPARQRYLAVDGRRSGRGGVAAPAVPERHARPDQVVAHGQRVSDQRQPAVRGQGHGRRSTRDDHRSEDADVTRRRSREATRGAARGDWDRLARSQSRRHDRVVRRRAPHRRARHLRPTIRLVVDGCSGSQAGVVVRRELERNGLDGRDWTAGAWPTRIWDGTDWAGSRWKGSRWKDAAWDGSRWRNLSWTEWAGPAAAGRIRPGQGAAGGDDRPGTGPQAGLGRVDSFAMEMPRAGTGRSSRARHVDRTSAPGAHAGPQRRAGRPLCGFRGCAATGAGRARSVTRSASYSSSRALAHRRALPTSAGSGPTSNCM